MTKYSECALLLNNIKGLLALYQAGELHQTLCDMLEKIPHASSPPPVPQLFLHIESPAKSSKSKNMKPPPSPVDIYNIVKSEYKHKEPKDLSVCIVPCVPDTGHDCELQNLEVKIRECRDIVTEVDNMTLYNAANFGNWLDVAFSTYQRDKRSIKSVWPSFGLWVESRCGITEKWAKELRNFYKLVSEYPQLLFCRLSLSFFQNNKKHILTFFSCEPELALKWKHPLVCRCKKCGPD